MKIEDESINKTTTTNGKHIKMETMYRVMWRGGVVYPKPAPPPSKNEMGKNG